MRLSAAVKHFINVVNMLGGGAEMGISAVLLYQSICAFMIA